MSQTTRDVFLRLIAFVPERNKAYKARFACDPKSVRVWLGHLPLTNAETCAQQLLELLHDMNLQRLDPAQRLDSLELIRAPLAQVQNVLDTRARGDSFPLPTLKRQAMDVAQDLQQQMSVSYIVALYDFCAPGGDVPFMKGKLVALAATRAMQHAGMLLARSYLLYLAPAPNVWRILHRVYRFVDERGLTERMVDDPLPEGGELNAMHAYLQALLLALNNPYRFTQKENVLAYQLARAWAPYCKLQRDSAIPGGLGVDLNGDRGLGYLEQERSTPGPGEWSFHYDELEKRLEADIARLPEGGRVLAYKVRGAKEFTVDLSLVRAIMKTWADERARTHTRLPGDYQLDSLLGLQTAHYVLAGNHGFESFLQTLTDVPISLSDQGGVAAWVNTASENLSIRVLHATVLDQSLGGYRLFWPAGENLRARIGELVILKPAMNAQGESQHWMVGVMRWMRIQPDSSVEAGVVLLARHAKAACLRSYDKSGNLLAPMRAILLEPLDDQNFPATVITPPVLDRHLDKVQLIVPSDDDESDARTIVIEDLTVLSDSGSYLRFAWNDPNAVDVAGLSEFDTMQAPQPHSQSVGATHHE